ncbi:MAG: divergent PAP2 family protein [Oscillatoriales cyanobacterium SM2_1_8]|nr:divergent PAP2 family protein [Oscillatoriales cyanobacterium SM2_1_8]
MADPTIVLGNRILWGAVAASLSAQSLKLILVLVQERAWRPRVLFETGGMPSSHSALVTALATGIGKTQGWDSSAFAIATVFAIVVMYDATGIRRAAGNQAKAINQIVSEVLAPHHDLEWDPLKELLGHTPLQVAVGSLWGLAIAWFGV